MGEERKGRSDAGGGEEERRSPSDSPTKHAPDGVRRGWSARWFAWLLSHGGDFDRDLYGERKQDLLGGLSGTVVEIGPGAGVNLPYYADDVRWIGIEPNVYFHPRLHERLADLDRAGDVRAGTAERLALPDASADAVVSTLVLCSVDDLSAALAEIRRVLRPGGRFVFIEHVAAPPGSLLRRVQRGIKPLWGVVGDGCRPDRETGRLIERAGFADVHIERFDAAMPLPVVRPHIAGTARRM